MTSAAAAGRMAGTARRAVARPETRRMIRGAMLTPWAAVSGGVVLAASLTLATPRTVLTFPPSRAARCQVSGCGPTVGSGRSARPAVTQGVKFPSVGGGTAGPGAGGLAAQNAKPAGPGLVRVQYALLPRNGHHFIALIVITGERALGNWTLRFMLPGSQIKLVMWAKWMPIGEDGGVVSGSPWPSERPGALQAQVVLMGLGSPARPSGCVFDGARCSFRDFDGGVSHFTWTPGHSGGGPKHSAVRHSGPGNSAVSRSGGHGKPGR
jgi:hypothetical protein